MFPSRLNHCARALLPMLLALSLLASCGGGVDSGGTGAPAAYALGPVSGFGSIIVNGVRFDDSTAVIQDDDGTLRSRDQLKLGMVTEVDASDFKLNAGKESATASSIRIVSDIIGPVGAVDPRAASLTVLGQTVLVTAATVFDANLPGGLAGVAVASVVEVHGRYDAARGRYTATRIERRTDAALYKLRGPVSAIDPVAKTLVIGGQTISYAQLASAADAQLGKLVRARLQRTPENGVWIAVALDSGVSRLPDRDDAQVEGRITAWTSSRQFSVDGIAVDAGSATFAGSEAAVQLGARVEVEGASSAGVLHARVVKVEGDESEANSSFELHGAIDTLDTATKTFTVHGVSVDYSGPVQFESGSASDLAPGRRVQVQGTLSPDGERIQALSILFEGT